jgi:hypothetical protein
VNSQALSHASRLQSADLPAKSGFYEQVTVVKGSLLFFIVSLSLLLVVVDPRCCSPPCFYSHF